MVEVFKGLTQEYKEMLMTRFNPERIDEEFSPHEVRLIIFFNDSRDRQIHSPDLRFILSAHFSNFGFFIPSGNSVLISFRLNPKFNKYDEQDLSKKLSGKGAGYCSS
jgi:hypothetical protein